MTTSGPDPQRSERGPGGARSRDGNRALGNHGDRELPQGFRNWCSGSVGEDISAAGRSATRGWI